MRATPRVSRNFRMPLVALLVTVVALGALFTGAQPAPAQTGGSGICSLTPTKGCLLDADCPAGEVCILPGGGGEIIQAAGNTWGCMNDVYNIFGQGGDLNCTANDVVIAATHGLEINEVCDFPGDTATITFIAEFDTSATTRYDVGAYIAADGGDALAGSCSISNVPWTPDPPWYDDDGAEAVCSLLGTLQCSGDDDCTGLCDIDTDYSPDPTCSNDRVVGCTLDSDCDFGSCAGDTTQDTCGDIRNPENTPIYHQLDQIVVECVDHDGDGFLETNVCLSWRQSGHNELCTSPLGAFPGAPSKCRCQDLPGIEVPVPPRIIVDKVTDPTGEEQSFDFHLTQGMNNLDDFGLTDEDDPWSSADDGLLILDADLTYSVSEDVAPDPWVLLDATCVSDQGYPDQDPGSISLHPGETVTCTFTNLYEPVTAVNLLSFTAAPQAGSIHVEWQTGSEIDNLGFNLFRALSSAGARTQLNDSLIPSAQPPGSPFGASYSWLDTEVVADTTYYYWLEDVDFAGHGTLHGPVTALIEPASVDDPNQQPPDDPPPAPETPFVPEASTLLLLGSAASGLAGYVGLQIRARRRR